MAGAGEGGGGGGVDARALERDNGGENATLGNLMRFGLITACLVALGAAVPSTLPAQRIVPRAVPDSAPALSAERAGAVGALGMTATGDPVRPAAVRTVSPPAVVQADSLASTDTRAETGAIIGGLTGALAGGVLFAHFTHRDGAVNNGTGTLGGAIVGAGLLGGMGALVGLLVGGALSH